MKRRHSNQESRTGAPHLLLGAFFVTLYFLLDAAIEAYVLDLGDFLERLTVWDREQLYERFIACLLIAGLAGAAKVIQVTRRGAAERQQAWEKQYLELLETAHEGVWLLDVRGQTLFVNRNMARMLGRTEEELAGQPISALAESRGGQKALFSLVENRDDRKAEIRDLILRHVSGRRVYARVSSCPVVDPEGRTTGVLAFVSDLTAERSVAEALRASEEKFQRAFRNSPDAVTITRLSDGVLLEANEGFTKMTGYTAEEAVGATTADLDLYVDPSDRAKLITRLTSEGSIRDLEARFRRKDGSTLAAMLNVSALMIGDEPCALTTARDITDQRRAEREIESLARFPSENPFPVLRVDHAGKLLYFNEAGKVLLEAGTREGDLAPSFLAETAAEVLRAGDQSTMEASAGGRYYSLGFAPFPELSYVNIYGREVTEQVRAEEALRDSEARLRSILQSVAGGVVVQNGEGMIVEANPAACQILDLSLDQLLGRTSRDPDWRSIREDGSPLPDLEHPLTVTRQTGMAVSDVVTGVFIPSLGKYRWLLVNSQPILGPDGGVRSAVATFVDITERRQTQAFIEASLREKEVLLREVHHRVKNNLQVISSLLGLKALTMADTPSREAFRDVQSRVRAMSLLHEKLYRSRDLSMVELRSYLPELLAHLLRGYGAPEDTLVLEGEGDHPLSLETAVPAGMVVNELVNNSLKHAFPKGEMGKIRIGLAHLPSGETELVVGDNGVGMAEEPPTDRMDAIGLQLVGTLVRQMSGTIERLSGPGTTYRIVFGDGAAAQGARA